MRSVFNFKKRYVYSFARTYSFPCGVGVCGIHIAFSWCHELSYVSNDWSVELRSTRREASLYVGSPATPVANIRR